MFVSWMRWIMTILIADFAARQCWLAQCTPSLDQLTPPCPQTSWEANLHFGIHNPQSLPNALRAVDSIISFASRSLYDGGVLLESLKSPVSPFSPYA